MMKLNIEIETSEYVVREVDTEDSWDQGETGLNVHGVMVTATDKDYGWDIPIGATNRAVVLVEHFGDGCTFGSSEYADVKGVFLTEQDARDYAKTLNIDHGYFGWHIAFKYYDIFIDNGWV